MIAARWLPASARPLIARARAIAERAPSPIASRVTDAARTLRDRRRDDRRDAFSDDGSYFDDLVARAIASAHTAADSAEESAR